jgi:cytosine/adenosine deaminase-related metal-dependent hydrolase
MVDLLVDGGTVVTMNAARDVLEDGAVAVEGGEIRAVGPAGELRADYDPDRVIDAGGHAVVPGFVDAHVHVNDVLLRGLGGDRALHDWLLNVNKPGIAALGPDEEAISAALYCTEAIRSGITFFVDNAAGTGPGMWLDADHRDARFGVYRDAGLRTVFAQEFVDERLAADDRFERFLAAQTASRPGSDPEPVEPLETAEALDRIEGLIEADHAPEDRRSVWPAPIYPWAVSPAGLRGAYDLAERYDVMTSTHVSEVTQQERNLLSSVEYLDKVGYLGERALLGHCVHLDERDVRLLAETGTKVAHNLLTNLALGSGIAPVPTMHGYGVDVGIGTDNASASDTVDMLTDVRFAAMVHDGVRQDPGAITARKALAMATIEGARAVGRADDLGSLEPGKRADLVLVDLEHPHLTPAPDVVSALVYRARGSEVDTVLCDGEVIMTEGTIPGIADRFPDLLDRARDAAARITEASGLSSLEE